MITGQYCELFLNTIPVPTTVTYCKQMGENMDLDGTAGQNVVAIADFDVECISGIERISVIQICCPAIEFRARAHFSLADDSEYTIVARERVDNGNTRAALRRLRQHLDWSGYSVPPLRSRR
jgi:hypothetical protein